MKNDWVLKDRVIARATSILEKVATSLGVEFLSIVLYGSRARGERNSQNDYEFLILLNNDIDLEKYITFNDKIKLKFLMEKVLNVKVILYSAEVFENTLYNDEVLGTFIYMICRDNIVLFDKVGTFAMIHERLSKYTTKSEENFLIQCIDFSKMMGSQKWEQKWEKTLMQHRYLVKRRLHY